MENIANFQANFAKIQSIFPNIREMTLKIQEIYFQIFTWGQKSRFVGQNCEQIEFFTKAKEKRKISSIFK